MNSQSTGTTGTVKPGRADADFDAAKYTPAPVQPGPQPQSRWTPPTTTPSGTPNAGIQAISDAVRSTSMWVQPLRTQMGRVIVGQEQLVDRLMIGLIKTFVALDNGFKREDSVKDIGALLDWIARQPELDADRVMVTGGSYGGYMTLAVAIHYNDRIRCALNVVGISNFVTFLQNTEDYRRDLRRVEYGDERDPEMHAHLQKISPTTRANEITKPLFIVQGANDPRVPRTEATQMVETVRKNGSPVWYLEAKDEGHGFRKKANADFQFYATVMFIREHLLP